MPTSPRKPTRPVLWIIAGPNGSGKSTLYSKTDIEGWGGSVWIINPDLLTTRLIEAEGLGGHRANSAALNRIMNWLEASVEVHQTIGVETVLSTGKYRNLVRVARAKGFEVRLVYVLLRDVGLQLARIAQRVSDGGHDVPSAKVASRRRRSLRQLPWFARQAAKFYLFDNSTGEPELVASFDMESENVETRRVPQDLREMLFRRGLTVGAALFACQSGSAQ